MAPRKKSHKQKEPEPEPEPEETSDQDLSEGETASVRVASLPVLFLRPRRAL
jgi:hypothetical protein